MVNCESLIKFIAPAGTPITALTPTAWGGHIPFMFCLMNFIKPRTYVELGTHYGASFFAVCQAIEEFKIECSPVAIDLWLGDEHAGYYKEEVYDAFNWIHQHKFRGLGKTIRKDFNDAADEFESKTIDLIHIDGLHTYEAVKNDYETWLPKLSDDGVILFHDTMVRERGFGVWKFWEEIKDKYPSFNFTHTHGLGVIAKGTIESNPMIALIQAINHSEDSKASFDNFFKLIGERSVNEALAKIRLEEGGGAKSSRFLNVARRVRKLVHL